MCSCRVFGVVGWDLGAACGFGLYFNSCIWNVCHSLILEDRNSPVIHCSDYPVTAEGV